MRGADRERNEIIMRGDGSGHTEHHLLLLLLNLPPRDKVPPRLSSNSPCLPPCSHLSLLSCLTFSRTRPRVFSLVLTSPALFLDSRREAARRGARDMEKKCVREGTLSSSRSYKAISVPVKLRRSLRRLSSSPSCLVIKVFIQPGIVSRLLIFREKTRGAECDSVHSHGGQWEQLEMKRRLRGLGGGGGVEGRWG